MLRSLIDSASAIGGGSPLKGSIDGVPIDQAEESHGRVKPLNDAEIFQALPEVYVKFLIYFWN